MFLRICFFELHDLHNDYPLASDKIQVTKETLSEYQLQIIEENKFYLGKNEKLIHNLVNKKQHYKNLKRH